MLLQNLIEGVDVTCVEPAHLDQRICDLTEDSRTALPGSLFIARRGTRLAGTSFVGDAIERGAVAVLVDAADAADLSLPDDVAMVTTTDVERATAEMAERFFGHPSRQLTVIGVTGTNGKTTIAHLIHQLANAGGVRCGLIGTVSIDDGLEVAQSAMTTPPAIEISHALASMVESGCVAASLEVSSHALAQQRVAGLDFDIAIFTNISGDHLDYHDTLDAYIAAKSRLFAMLDTDGLAIINIDDPRWEAVIGKCAARRLTCSLDPEANADCHAEILDVSLRGVEAVFVGPWGEVQVCLPLIGRHNVMNALQAVAAAHESGVPRPDLSRTLGRVKPAPGRLEIVQRDVAHPDPFVTLVDYAHTDHALETALQSLIPLKPTPRSRIRLVFGCGGERDRTKRPRMMRVAAKLADDVIVTNDNPRSERPASIIRDMLDGLPDSDSSTVTIQPDRRRAIYDAVMAAREDDIVLIAGKGHEDYQLLPDGRGGYTSTPFDDRVVVRDALLARLGPSVRVSGSGAAVTKGATG